MTTTNDVGYLTRSNVWSSQIKEILEDELMAQGYVDWMSEFPDGDTFNIPSIGQNQVDDYDENSDVAYHALDTGNFTFSINKYKSSGNYITNKAKQDMFYMNALVSKFVPGQSRAIMEKVEEDVFALANTQPSGQGNSNAIDGTAHRWIASGTNEVMTVQDFAKARFALKKANVPDQALVAIVDPSVEYQMNTLTNLTNVSNNPKWEGIIGSGIAQGATFLANIYGFDVYTSNRLADANETIGGLTTAAGKANMFFSAMPDVLPFIGAWRQMPVVDGKYNQDKQREEYITTARYGTKLYRPENLVVIPSDTDQVV